MKLDEGQRRRVQDPDRLYARLGVTPEQLQQFCQRWWVAELAVFGSVLREDFGPQSDVDVLVTYLPMAPWSLFDVVEMKEEMEALVQRPVDWVERVAIEQNHNWIRRRTILDSAEILYVA